MATQKTIKAPLTVETLNHDATRKNTRTRDRLLVTATEPASEFLDDLLKVS